MMLKQMYGIFENQNVDYLNLNVFFSQGFMKLFSYKLKNLDFHTKSITTVQEPVQTY